ncbi:MAG TPA: M23 family metallopeptidase [Chitinophagaceae bacterium]|nr:M23 family metallopeptidase [Chitinophagaceae bacterium]
MLNYRIVILHKPFLFFCFQLFFSQLSAQLFPAKNYPKGYFIYPVEAKIGLAANFGELRPNHYHMGLDCRTDQKQNIRVIAAADGYIAHVRIEPSGFGRAIYINHPNGLTTLYAHLNNFFPELEKYVKEQQYKLESWQVFLDIPAGLFPVKQGQFIAFSGNTGGSQGPHTHFEIRNTKTDKVLNPSLFRFAIPDNVPPTITRLAMYDRCVSTYSQTPKFSPLKKIGGRYTTSSPIIITNTERVSFAISATDRYTGSANPNGIYEAIIYYDELAIAGFQLDNISYDETRYLNAHIDHKLKTGGGPYVEHLSRLPGYPEGVYKDGQSDGIIYLEDDSVHQIKIEVKDAYGNTSVLQFSIKRGFINEDKHDQSPEPKFVPGFVNVFEREDVQVILNENDLYDSINFNYAKKNSATPQAVSALHTIHTALVPVHGYFTIRLKRDDLQNIPGKIIMQRTWGSKMDVVKPEKNGEWFTGKFREFGNFQLLADNVPPVISPIGIRDNANLSRSSQIIFTIMDNMKEIKNFRAELDGKWLRFTNDKGRSFIYKFDEMCPPGEHELKVSVEDEAGNETQRIFHFSR